MCHITASEWIETKNEETSKTESFTSQIKGFTVSYFTHNSTNDVIAPTEHIRVYKNAKLTIKSNSGNNITKVVIAVTDKKYALGLDVNGGEKNVTTDAVLNTITWEGIAEEFEAISSEGQIRISSIVVTTDGEELQEEITKVDAPTFNIAGGAYESELTIELNCLTEAASIYYTLDGEEPTKESVLYTEPFKLNATTTVKALAVYEELESEVVSATYEINIDLSVYLDAPVATEATEVTTKVFVAHWEAVEGASSYLVNVALTNTVFNENVEECESAGGNDDSWSGSIANGVLPELKDWTIERGYPANGCIKLGASSALGSATTPSLENVNGDVVLSFRAAAWNGNNEKTTLKLSVVNSGILDHESVTLEKGKFNTYSVIIKDATAETRIKFEGQTASSSRFFLDDVKVTSHTEVVGSPVDVTTTSIEMTELPAENEYAYSVVVKGDGGNDVDSEKSK